MLLLLIIYDAKYFIIFMYNLYVIILILIDVHSTTDYDTSLFRPSKPQTKYL